MRSSSSVQSPEVLRRSMADTESSVSLSGVAVSEIVRRSSDFVGVGRNFMQQIKMNTRNVNFFILGDSTSGPSYPWVLQLAGYMAALFPTHSVNYRIWSDGLDGYGNVESVSVGTGANTIEFYNASVSGATATFFNSYRRDGLFPVVPDLVVFNYGHNFASASSRDQIYSFHYSSIADIVSDNPTVEHAVIMQNIDTANLTYSERQSDVMQNIASVLGVGIIDFRSVFVQKYLDGNIDEWMVDSVHPSVIGYSVMSNIVLRALLASKKYNCIPIDLITDTRPNLLFNEHFFRWLSGESLPQGFFSNSFLDAEKDFLDNETLGYSLKLSCNNDNLGVLSTDQSNILGEIPKNKGFTFAARVKVEVGSGSNAGRVEINLGNATISSVAQTQGRGGWMWVSAYARPDQMKLAKNLILKVYSGNGSDITRVDRLTCSVGRIFTDAQFKYLPISDYYNQASVFPKTSNDIVVVDSVGGVSVVNTVGLYPGFFLDLNYLEIGESYKASWKTDVAGVNSGAYVRNYGGVGGLRESVVPLGVESGGDLVGELEFSAVSTTASIQFEIINSAGGTAFNLSDLTIVKL